jgi:hypothetical protein
MRHARFGWLAATLFFSAMALAPDTCAAGDLTKHASYNDGAVQYDLDTYVDGSKVVALIGLKSGGTTISFAFDQAEWPKVLKLWQDARAMSGSTYSTAGMLREIGSSAQCVITMAGGPDVRVTVVDPTVAAFVFVVHPADQDDFESKLREIGDAATIVN